MLIDSNELSYPVRHRVLLKPEKKTQMHANARK